MIVDGVEVITDPYEVSRLLQHDSVIGFDTETTGLSPQRDLLALIQLYGDQTGTLGLVQVRDGIIPDCIVALLESPDHLFIGHNVVNFDLPFLLTHGVDWKKSRWYDTLVGETAITSSGRRNVSVSLRNSVRRRLDLKIDKDIEHGGWANESLSEQQIIYASQDVLSLPALRRAQLEKAKESDQLNALDMEMELMPAVSLMYSTGLPLKVDILLEFVNVQSVAAEMHKRHIQEILGDINIDSPVQLLKAVQEKYGVHMGSTSKEYLADIIQDDKFERIHDIARMILDYRVPRQMAKMYTIDWMNQYIINDRVHSRFWQCSADTSRFTSSGPNLQQWPKVMRHVIGNTDGLKMVWGDYSQIEVRIAASIAHDEKLLATLEAEDVHRAVASEVYKLPPENISDVQRKNAKAETFSLLFDGTAKTLYRHSKALGGSLTMNEAIGMERLFFETFTGLARMREKAHATVRRTGPVIIRLPNGMRRILAGDQKTASRVLNTMVQGSAAVGIKYGIIEAHRRGLVDGYMGAQVHDELVSSVPDSMANEYAKELEECMITGMKKVIPCTVKVDMRIGDHWER